MSAFHSIHPSRRCQCGSAETVATFLPTGRECCGPCLVDEISDHRLIVLHPHYYAIPPHKVLAGEGVADLPPKSSIYARWRSVLSTLHGDDWEVRR